MVLRATADNAAASSDFTTTSYVPPISRQNIRSADLFFFVLRAMKCELTLERYSLKGSYTSARGKRIHERG